MRQLLEEEFVKARIAVRLIRVMVFQMFSWGYNLCFIFTQCKGGFAGDGEECEVDPDLDDIPVKGLSCTLPNCRKVCFWLYLFEMLTALF